MYFVLFLKLKQYLKINQQSVLLACFCSIVSYFSQNVQLFVVSSKTIIFLFSLLFYFSSCRFYCENF